MGSSCTMSFIIRGANLHYATMLLSLILDNAASQCVPTPPCQTCELISVQRNTEDCRGYVYCLGGNPTVALTCGWNEVFSTRSQRCVSRDSTDECSSINEVVPGYYPYYRPPQRQPESNPVFGSGYRYSKWLSKPPSSDGYGYLRPGLRYPYYHGPSASGLLHPSSTPGYNPNVFYPGIGYDNSYVREPQGITRGKQLSESCGVKSSNWIVGGQESYPGKWAWQVSLQKYDVALHRWVHVCGATLVHQSWIVTAGHCIHALSGQPSVSAVLGSYNLSSIDPGEQRIRVDKLVAHPSYSHGGNYPNDIGLAHLTSPATTTRSIGPVCLPEQEAAGSTRGSSLHASGSRCWVTGWGRTLGRTDAHVLNEAEVEMVTREECANSWTGYLTFSHICAAGRGGAGACEGDSGGPLTCLRDGRYYLEGVVSWGEDSCLLSGYPSVFTKVALYTDWIQNTVASTRYP
ncbi:chymotrypsin-like elastase family member 1 [Plakobranchus ocellatus]|uniref:Chymotrypsin-like elastase family member 1 n=1 Tax=Plakobranchus ocellatus TaxID=259542 RepID=A0AAV3ZG30_9GAST|nr:chymotrypsin-like elastase family member 1 [Plakobranchus ocellatus]